MINLPCGVVGSQFRVGSAATQAIAATRKTPILPGTRIGDWPHHRKGVLRKRTTSPPSQCVGNVPEHLSGMSPGDTHSASKTRVDALMSRPSTFMCGCKGRKTWMPATSAGRTIVLVEGAHDRKVASFAYGNRPT